MKAIKFDSIAANFREEASSVTTRELTAFFNANAENFGFNEVKRFADRTAAERRVHKLLKAMDDAAREGEEVVCGYSHCPHCGVHLDNGFITQEQMIAAGTGIQNRNKQREVMCLACEMEFGPLLPERQAVDPARSAGVKESWQDEVVRIKRATRHNVKVKARDGSVREFRSVRQAFVDLGLPLNKHIKFRMELKAEGQLNEYGYSWEVIES